MAIDMFEARSLTNAINKVKTIDPFILNLFWKGKDKYHATDAVDIEIYKTGSKIAQFVTKGGEPLMVGKGIKAVKTVKIPMTWEKKIFDAVELAAYKQLPGVYISASDIETRANQFVLRELEDLKQRVLRRREQMACEAISTGKIQISQDNIAFSIDFGFESNKHLITLDTAAKWTAATPNPTIIAQLRSWKSAIMKRSGYSPTILILGADAATAFLGDAGVMKALDTNNYRIGGLDLNSPALKYGNFLGKIIGLDVYEYNQVYINQAGNEVDMIAKDRAIMAIDQVETELHHGPLYRIEGQNLKLYQVDQLIEVRTNEDKTYLEWKNNQSSLTAINDPDGFLSVDVL